MYPLNMKTEGAKPGFAVANNEAEHAALTAAGYLPALVVEPIAPLELPADEVPDGDGRTVASVRAELDAAGIAYDKRLGLARLIELLP